MAGSGRQDVPQSQAMGQSSAGGSSTTTINTDSQDLPFSRKFRRLRACARCHRLKMRCVFANPEYQSCTRCFKSGLRCSMTEDPTEKEARSRPRKRAKIHEPPLVSLQSSVAGARKYLLKIQKDLVPVRMKEVEGIADSAQQTDSSSSGAGFDSSSTNSPSFEKLSQDSIASIQQQLTSLQKLLSHVYMLKKKDLGLEADGKQSQAFSAASMKDGPVKTVPALPYIAPELNIMKELFKLDIISEGTAKEKLNYFNDSLLSYWPCVSLPKTATYEYLLEEEPLSLLAFVAVTCLNEPDLHDTLLYYLEGSLARKTSITGDITVGLIEIYLVLSLWCSPPKKWGSYKHQMSLMMALNISLCLDLGNDQYLNKPSVLSDSSKERRVLRSFMGVYACCGSLGLSLPRFKVVNWTSVHRRCANLLLMGDSTPEDRFLCFYSRLVSIGEEIFEFLYPLNGRSGNELLRGELGTKYGTISKNSEGVNLRDGVDGELEYSSSGASDKSLRAIMVGYERQMQQLAMESGLFTGHSKQKNMFSIIYYQLLMTMYDYVVCKVLLMRKESVVPEAYMQTLLRLVKASEKVIQSFMALCKQTPNFPTFFYYRPMHALVALIRARLLVKTQALDVDIDVESNFEAVSSSLKELSKKSKVAAKMSVILTRISKWMKVSNKFNKDGATNSMVDLLNELGKEKAVESIKVTMKRREGDNSSLRPDSRIKFKRFINYSPDMLSGKHGSAINVEQFASNMGDSIRAENFMKSERGNHKTMEAVNMESGGSKARNLSTSSTNSGFIPSPIGFSSGEYPLPKSRRMSSTSNEQQRYLHQPGNGSPSFFSPGVTSGMTPIGELGSNLTLQGNGADSGASAGSEFQQQYFLNDLFSQIDDDLMNFQFTGDNLSLDLSKSIDPRFGSFSAADYKFN